MTNAPDLKEALEAENKRRAAAGQPLLPVVSADKQTNHGGNETWQPTLAFRPTTDIDQLSDLMSFLAGLRATTGTPQIVKAGGSRHSWSPAATSSQVYIHPEDMGFVTPILDDARERAALRADLNRPEDCFLIGSGARIRAVNDALWAPGKALPILGGYDGQTLAGVLQTGTHGSVLQHGPIIDVVLAINLVDGQGRRHRIEPAGGSTDPTAFAAGFTGWELHQDSDLFNAALVSAGAFGIVHSYIVRVVDAFYLNETRTLTSLTALRRLLRGGNIYRLMDVVEPPGLAPDDGRRLDGHPPRVYHLEFLVNPHPTHGDHTVIVTSRAIFKLNGPEPGVFGRPRSDDKYLFRVLGRYIWFSRPALTTWISEHFPRLLAWLPNAVGRILPGSVPDLLDTGMKNIVDESFQGRSYNVFNIGNGQNSIPALSSEPSIPLRDDLYLEALDLILTRAAHFATEGKMHTGPLAMRFVAGRPAMLADPEDVCRFEIIFTAATNHAPMLMRDYEDNLYARFGGDVRPHWGQINNLSATTRSRLSEMYPRLDDWQRLRRAYDSDDLFLNDWQRSLFA